MVDDKETFFINIPFALGGLFFFKSDNKVSKGGYILNNISSNFRVCVFRFICILLSIDILIISYEKLFLN